MSRFTSQCKSARNYGTISISMCSKVINAGMRFWEKWGFLSECDRPLLAESSH